MSASRFKEIPTPHLFAHRGGNEIGAGKENTKAAFSGAEKLGYKFFETDVIATKDNQVICYHGSWRPKDGLQMRRKLQKMTYAEIKQKQFIPGENIPKLSDILSAFPEVCFSIDVKTKEVIRPVAKLLREFKAEDRVIITSFSLYRTLKANQLLRGDKLQASLCLSIISGYLSKPFLGLYLSLLKAVGVSYLQVHYKSMTRRFVKLAHQRKMKVYVWTVNDADSIRKMQVLGVDGIMSDEIKLLNQVVKTKSPS